jgi:hypothetical protein
VVGHLLGDEVSDEVCLLLGLLTAVVDVPKDSQQLLDKLALQQQEQQIDLDLHSFLCRYLPSVGLWVHALHREPEVDDLEDIGAGFHIVDS